MSLPLQDINGTHEPLQVDSKVPADESQSDYQDKQFNVASKVDKMFLYPLTGLTSFLLHENQSALLRQFPTLSQIHKALVDLHIYKRANQQGNHEAANADYPTELTRYADPVHIFALQCVLRRHTQIKTVEDLSMALAQIRSSIKEGKSLV